MASDPLLQDKAFPFVRVAPRPVKPRPYGLTIIADRGWGMNRVDDVLEMAGEYIDWVNAVGAIILGHADPVVDTAVKDQIDHGSLYTLNGPIEIELAEELIDTIPSAEMVRYTKGGGEACAVAARIARTRSTPARGRPSRSTCFMRT